MFKRPVHVVIHQVLYEKCRRLGINLSGLLENTLVDMFASKSGFYHRYWKKHQLAFRTCGQCKKVSDTTEGMRLVFKHRVCINHVYDSIICPDCLSAITDGDGLETKRDVMARDGKIFMTPEYYVLKLAKKRVLSEISDPPLAVMRVKRKV